MGFLSACMLFGWDLGSFLRNRKGPKSILSSISFLQTFKSLTADAEQVQPVSTEIELVQMSQAIARRIGEKEILSLSEHMIPGKVVKEIITITSVPNTLHEQGSLVGIEDLLEVPKSVVDVVMDQ